MMYLNYFGLKKEPFQITPDPYFLYLSRGHKEALASIIYGVEKKKGFVLIVGPVGVGKTTILRAYLEKVDKNHLKTIYIFNSNISYNTLLKHILRDLDISTDADETSSLLTLLHDCLVEEYRHGRNVLLLIDEAQNMPVDTLENLRMLSNLETTTDKLIQVVFCGQPEFEKTLNLKELKQLKQRLAVKTVISPLTTTDGIAYIHHRLNAASGKALSTFTPFAIKRIVKHAKGIPRVINVLCDNCLITAFGYGKKKVTTSIVDEILNDFDIKQRGTTKIIAVMLALLIAIYTFVVINGGGIWTINPKKSNNGIKITKNVTPNTVIPLPKEDSITTNSPKTVKFVHKTVSRGDTLAKLIVGVYGHVDKKMIRLVKKANPHISDENVIIEGGRIAFPVKSEK